MSMDVVRLETDAVQCTLTHHPHWWTFHFLTCSLHVSGWPFRFIERKGIPHAVLMIKSFLSGGKDADMMLGLCLCVYTIYGGGVMRSGALTRLSCQSEMFGGVDVVRWAGSLR
jgi:hypothetical protein